ncbi:phage tail terminator family protein [Paenibacillus eucommiae]
MNDVKNGMIQRLDEIEPSIPVYEESSEQGFTGPAFFVSLLSSEQTREAERRYLRSLLFDVQYYPAGPAKKAECSSMADRLYEGLENIEAGTGSGTGLCEALTMRHEVVNDVLHFFISFGIHLIKAGPDETKMNQMVQEGQIKHV